MIFGLTNTGISRSEAIISKVLYRRLCRASSFCFSFSKSISFNTPLILQIHWLHSSIITQFYILLTCFLYNVFQMKPTSCTLLLSIFISTSVHVSGTFVLIISRIYSIYATPVFFTLYGCLSGLQTRRPVRRPHRVKNTGVA
jgi:hypothetical protein